MATNQTTNYQLNQWEPTDQVLRTDFNAGNGTYAPLTDDQIGNYLEDQGYTGVQKTRSGWSFEKGYNSWTGVDIQSEQVYLVTFTSGGGVTVDNAFVSGGTGKAYMNNSAFDIVDVTLDDSNGYNWGTSTATNVDITCKPAGASIAASSDTHNGNEMTVRLTVTTLTQDTTVSLEWKA